MELLEELVRGNSLRVPNDSTKMFAQMFYKIMQNNGCLGPNKEIINDNLVEAFENDSIDI